MAGARRARGLRLRHGRRPAHPALPRPPARRDNAANRPDGPGERLRRLARTARPPGRDASRSRVPHLAAVRARCHDRTARGLGELRGRAVAHLDPPARRRARGDRRALRAPRRRRRRAPLASAERAAWAPAGGPPLPLRSRRSRAAPRESGLPGRPHGRDGAGALATVPVGSSRGLGVQRLEGRSRLLQRRVVLDERWFDLDKPRSGSEHAPVLLGSRHRLRGSRRHIRRDALEVDRRLPRFRMRRPGARRLDLDQRDHVARRPVCPQRW